MIKNTELKKIIWASVAAVGIVTLLTIISIFFTPLETEVSNPISQQYKQKLQVHFLNVGGGDCSYIHCGENNILIDAADIEPAGLVSQYLTRHEVKNLDLAVASHPHRDHIGQMSEILEKFPTNEFMMPEVSEKIIPETQAYTNLINILKEKNVNIKKAKFGDTFYIGELKVDVLGPIKKNKKLNNNSLVLKFTYEKISFLFTGDAEKEEENSILKEELNLSSTVLKVGHHGSNTSSTLNFLKKVKPKFSVVSTARDKPLKDVVKNRFEAVNSKIFSTDKSGTLLFLSSGEDIEIIEEKAA